MTSPYPTSSDRLLSGGTLALLGGTAVNGLAGYGFLVIGTRAIGAQAYAPIPILWTLWSITVALLTVPIQHWIVRTVRTDGDESGVYAALPTLVGIAVGFAAITLLITWSARSTLFRTSDLTLPLLASCIPIGALAVGFLRGVLVERGRLITVAVAIAIENLVRLVGAVLVAAKGGGVIWYAVVLVAGFGIVFFWPRVFVIRPSTNPTNTHRDRPLAFLAGIAGGSLLAQLILTTGPIILATIGGPSAQVTALFAALSLFGAPYLIALGAAPQLTKALTGKVVDGRDTYLRRVRVMILTFGVVGGAVAGVFGAVAGRLLVTAFFGAEVTLPTACYVAIAAASTLALATLAQSLVLVARGRGRALTASWSIASVAYVGLAYIPVGGAAVRVTVALALAEVVALIALLSTEQRPARAAGA